MHISVDSEWFDVKWFIVEKLTDSDFFTAVMTGTRGHKVYKVEYSHIIYNPNQ